MKTILKVKTNSFIKNYKQNLSQDNLNDKIESKNIIDIIFKESDEKVKQMIKDGTITDKLLINAITNVMKEKMNNG
tara:strand:- start:320 stop:547 length:228 start_codon:yes stop_codon:yes gene_type:complete